ncbi:MAG TPA: DinB family protein [Gemmatimonadaceae bacterium]|nr:DinB family protein [Gemmatimonadaceae bacterium]
MGTMEEYTQRILSYQAGQNPLDLQAAMPAKLAALVDGIPHNVLTRRPAPEKWSIAEIVAHLADDELVGAYRIRMILGAPGTPMQAFDQDVWAVLGKYGARDTQLSLAQFRMLREMNLALFESLNAAQWQQYGVHAERGIETIADIAAYYAGHDLNHLQQIKAILG